MAGAKKKKKPAANPARGFATTSIASKPRPEAAEGAENAPQAPSTRTANAQGTSDPSTSLAGQSSNSDPSGTGTSTDKTADPSKELSPEEFEKQLEESELQLLVEKHAPKTRRDATRQRTRLETDRRLLRSQAETINLKKWLPQELMDHILDLIQAENRFTSSSLSPESSSNGKMLPEEDLVIRLWTLQQTLANAGFPLERVEAAIRYILEVVPGIQGSGKDSIWGLEEAMEWMARECTLEELPDYDNRGKLGAKLTGRRQ